MKLTKDQINAIATTIDRVVVEEINSQNNIIDTQNKKIKSDFIKKHKILTLIQESKINNFDSIITNYLTQEGLLISKIQNNTYHNVRIDKIKTDIILNTIDNAKTIEDLIKNLSEKYIKLIMN